MTRPYPYVYVLADGSARELHENERKYLETEFSGATLEENRGAIDK